MKHNLGTTLLFFSTIMSIGTPQNTFAAASESPVTIGRFCPREEMSAHPDMAAWKYACEIFIQKPRKFLKINNLKEYLSTHETILEQYNANLDNPITQVPLREIHLLYNPSKTDFEEDDSSEKEFYKGGYLQNHKFLSTYNYKAGHEMTLIVTAATVQAAVVTTEQDTILELVQAGKPKLAQNVQPTTLFEENEENEGKIILTMLIKKMNISSYIFIDKDQVLQSETHFTFPAHSNLSDIAAQVSRDSSHTSELHYARNCQNVAAGDISFVSVFQEEAE